MSVDSVTPTRMNLLQRKAQVKFAVDGVGLLKGKRDALMKELIDRARALRDMRNDLHTRGRNAASTISIASAMRGAPELQSAALGLRRRMEITVKTDKVWGLALGGVELNDIVRTPMRRPVSMLDTSAYVQEAAQSSEEMLEQLLKCAPLERNLQIIGAEVKKVSRRINALEEYLIPKLRGEMRQIARVLDEREREDVFRLKRIKGKKAAEKRLKEAKRKAAEAAEAAEEAEARQLAAEADAKRQAEEQARAAAEAEAKRKADEEARAAAEAEAKRKAEEEAAQQAAASEAPAAVEDLGEIEYEEENKEDE